MTASSHSPEHAHVAQRQRWLVPMAPRDPHEPHRAATPLELLFDLSFVVAIAQAAAHLHHGLAEGQTGHAVMAYGLVFFAITWCWVNFTWFASAWDTDDAAYRLKALLQITGALILAAGVPRAFEHQDFRLTTLGYTVMRVGMIANWLRAAHADPTRRTTCLRYALGLTLVQIGWVSLLSPWMSPWWVWGWLVLMPCELLVPVWAERAAATSWHPHHVAERYSLLVLIVIGELVLSTTTEIQAALDTGLLTSELIAIIVGSLLLAFSMWWLYFEDDAYHPPGLTRMTFFWGYLHMVIFAAVAAVGAGLALATDAITGHAHVSDWRAGLCVTIPMVSYIWCVWAVRIGAAGKGRTRSAALALIPALMLSLSGSRFAVLWSGVLFALLVGICAHLAAREPRAHTE